MRQYFLHSINYKMLYYKLSLLYHVCESVHGDGMARPYIISFVCFFLSLKNSVQFRTMNSIEIARTNIRKDNGEKIMTFE